MLLIKYGSLFNTLFTLDVLYLVVLYSASVRSKTTKNYKHMYVIYTFLCDTCITNICNFL